MTMEKRKRRNILPINMELNISIKKMNVKIWKVTEIFFDSNIKETIENYSTTMNCESNEHVMYPSEILLKCKNEKRLFSSEYAMRNALVCETHKNNSVFHRVEVFGESLLTLMNDLKHKWRSKSKTHGTNANDQGNNVFKKKNKLTLATKSNQINTW